MEVLRKILVDLLNPEKAAEATARMKDIKNDPQLLPNLMKLTIGDGEAQIRQMAAVILRKDLSRKFSQLSQNDQESLRGAVIQALTNEQNAAVWSAVAEVSAGILRKNASWPQFFQLVQQACESNTTKGAELLARMASSSPSVIREETTAGQCLQLVAKCFQDGIAANSSATLHQSLRALTAITAELTDANAPAAKQLMVQAIPAVEKIANDGETDWAVEGFQIFQTCLDSPVSLLNAQSLKSLVEWSARILTATDADPAFRCCAGNFIIQAVTSKSKSIKKNKMTKDLMTICFPILMENEEDEDDDDDDDTPRNVALQLLDTISIKMPNTEVLGVILEFAQQAAQGNSNQQCAALSSLAVICEGCASPLIEGGHVKSLIEFACTSLQSENPQLRSSALYAIGQFAEQMVGAVTEFAPEILRLVTKLLESPIEGLMKYQQLEKGLYCVEQLAETLDEDQLEQLLPSLLASMNRFMQMGNTNKCQSATLAVSALGVIIASAADGIGPHLNDCVKMLQNLLPKSTSAENADPEKLLLEASALDTLATLASSAGEAFVPIAKDSLQLAGQLVSGEADPDIRRAALNLSCSVVSLPNAPQEMLTVVPRILECLMDTLKSTEGIGVKYVGDADDQDPAIASEAFDAIEDLDDSVDIDGADDDGEEVEMFTVENSYLEEKHTALSSLIRMAQKIPQHIACKSQEMYKECRELTEFVNEDIRKFACAALIHLGHAIYKVSNNADALTGAIEKAIDMCNQDTDSGCALLVMAELSEVLDAYKTPILTQKLVEVVKNAMSGELICMMEDEDDEDSGIRVDEEASEIERELLDGAGELLTATARVDPSGVIQHGLADILQASVMLMKKPDSGSKACALGILADLFDTIGANSSEGFIKQLLPAFAQFTNNEDDNIRNNATYGIGVLVNTGGATGVQMMAEAMKCLPLDESKNLQIRDNVTGALARMLLVAPKETRGSFADQFLERLPLKEDHAEWRITLNLIEILLQEGNQKVASSLPELTAHCLNSVNNLNIDIQTDKKTLRKIAEFVKAIHDQNAQLFAELKEKTPSKVWNKLNKAST